MNVQSAITWRVAASCAAAFTLAAILVASGAATSLDEYAMRHLMPGFNPTGQAPPLLRSLERPLGGASLADWGDLVTSPAALVPASLLILTGLLFLLRRGRRLTALAYAAAFLLGNGIEALTKLTLTRPALSASWNGASVHARAFDNSFPSGHTLRAVLLAALAVTLWQRAGLLAVAWAGAVIVTLVEKGFHTPSDVAGGLLLGTCLLAARSEFESRMLGSRSGSDAFDSRVAPPPERPLLQEP
jgi:membrane-associated phospholipid phosphatase